ncbi:MAG: hypothetical protein ACTSWQ_03720, partial [Candidatus Thorarchaeota archaeon]
MVCDGDPPNLLDMTPEEYQEWVRNQSAQIDQQNNDLYQSALVNRPPHSFTHATEQFNEATGIAKDVLGGYQHFFTAEYGQACVEWNNVLSALDTQVKAAGIASLYDLTVDFAEFREMMDGDLSFEDDWKAYSTHFQLEGKIDSEVLQQAGRAAHGIGLANYVLGRFDNAANWFKSAVDTGYTWDPNINDRWGSVMLKTPEQYLVDATRVSEILGSLNKHEILDPESNQPIVTIYYDTQNPSQEVQALIDSEAQFRADFQDMKELYAGFPDYMVGDWKIILMGPGKDRDDLASITNRGSKTTRDHSLSHHEGVYVREPNRPGITKGYRHEVVGGHGMQARLSPTNMFGTLPWLTEGWADYGESSIGPDKTQKYLERVDNLLENGPVTWSRITDSSWVKGGPDLQECYDSAGLLFFYLEMARPGGFEDYIQAAEAGQGTPFKDTFGMSPEKAWNACFFPEGGNWAQKFQQYQPFE